jgi:hypothetical protein
LKAAVHFRQQKTARRRSLYSQFEIVLGCQHRALAPAIRHRADASKAQDHHGPGGGLWYGGRYDGGWYGSVTQVVIIAAITCAAVSRIANGGEVVGGTIAQQQSDAALIAEFIRA